MPVIFGEKREDGLIPVGSISWQISSHPNGISVNKIPEYPSAKKGINPVMLYDPIKEKFSFEEQARPLTKEELQEDMYISLNLKLDKIIELLSK
jgi:hypothetical protein